MFEVNLDYRTLGCRFDEQGNGIITLWAPLAESAAVELNGKDLLKMERLSYGYWVLVSQQIREGDRYVFQIDGQRKFPDPASLFQPEGVHGPSEAVRLVAPSGETGTWQGIPPENLIIYEIHTGTFSPEGTFRGIIERLDYLQDLGVNALEIMPVSEFPGDRNWGYDGVYVYAVQSSYGGYAGLQELVQACHTRGMAVILDVVYNHNGPEGNYLPNFGPYFTDKYRIPWGNAVNFDDAWSDGVRQYYIENALMWFRDFHIDGLRLDAVHAIRDFGPKHVLAELSEYVDQIKQLTGIDHFLIGECDLNDVKYIDPVAEGGYGLDAQWCDEFHHALHALATGEKLEYYADFGTLKEVEAAFEQAYVFDGQFSPHRKKRFGTKTGNRPGSQFVVFIQNHDQVGNRMLGERISQLVGADMLRLLAGAIFVSPYIPMLFMGEEYGEKRPFLYFNSHGDPELIRMVSEGRKNEFKEFFQAGTPADAQDPDTFERSKLTWDYRTAEGEVPLFMYYKEWIRLRKAHPVLKSRDRTGLQARQLDEKQVLVIRREINDEKLLSLMNFGPDPCEAETGIQIGEKMPLLIDSSSKEWGGQVPIQELQAYARPAVTLRPHSIQVYSTTKI